eukprot:m.192814 g.192814  ORF g.192814 m.192814 type:complete len:563 (+) comp18276_c0_seq1:459-2147(+)
MTTLNAPSINVSDTSGLDDWHTRQRALSDADTRQRARSRSNSCNVDHFDKKEGFGEKDITFWGSFCLNVNNCMGPAMVIFPLLCQQAGWVTPIVAMILVYVLSSLAATMLCEAMQRIPGNFNFEHRYEFASVVQHYWGRRAYWVFQVFYNISLQATNIAAMIISAQVVDKFVGHVAGHSYGLNYQQWPPRFISTSGDPDAPWCRDALVQGHCPSGKEITFVITIGFIVSMAVCIPFGYLNLDDNMWFQWFSLVGLLGFTFEFFGQFIYNLNKEDSFCIENANDNSTCFTSHNGVDRTPAFVASVQGQSQVVGVAVFAYAYIVTIPSWVNEKKHHVNVNRAVWIPASVGLVLKIAVGLLGGWAYMLVQPDGTARPESSDILNILTAKGQPEVTRYSAYLWDITTLIPGIPVLAIMVRYNLLAGNVCGKFWSFFWAVVAPWIITAFCYESNELLTLVNWIALLVQGYINFVIPALLYAHALKKYPDLIDQLETQASSETERLLRPQVSTSSIVAILEDPVHAVPHDIEFLGRVYRVRRDWVAYFLAGFFFVLSTASIILTAIVS